MATDDAERASAIVRDVADRLRTRLIVSSGWGGLGTIDHDEIHVVSDTPHHLLFPEMRAVIHHGGAGTTGTAFRAGVPQMAVPFFADQPFWGHRIAALGAGPRPLPRRDLDVDAFASAVEALIGDRYRARARELGDLISAEDGTAEAARFVGGLASR
jgi:UDP:flavonoid glycosyltransferase YjiC (YdhE family)